MKRMSRDRNSRFINLGLLILMTVFSSISDAEMIAKETIGDIKLPWFEIRDDIFDDIVGFLKFEI